ncbi:MAG: MarR family transcriptional regulator [Peptococcaceae bacterium]|jgi:DNA-binding MarR family transcriptional regulator|nr:MarR family transcriptional regulator [Peptococcaceae bacterium]
MHNDNIDNDKTATDLYEQFDRITWLLHRYHQHKHRQHGPLGDTRRGQGRVLALLQLKPEISQKELSDILDIRSQSLGELLAKLERNGYITRTPSPTDRRVIDIRLTEAGQQAPSENDEPSTEEATIFSCLNAAEQAALSDYLGRVIALLKEQHHASGACKHHDAHATEGQHRCHHHQGRRHDETATAENPDSCPR